MNIGNGMMKRIAKLGLLLMMGASMSACSKSWKEEVLLHDGSKIIVKRSVERGGRHEIGQRQPIKEQSLSFTLPSTNQRVEWEDSYSEDIGTASFLPMQLEIFNGTPYIVASPMGCLAYNKWGRPNPPYVIFKYDGKAWQRITLQELPAESAMPNLVISSPDDAAKQASHGVVSAEKIKKLNTGFKQPEYKTILREALKPGTRETLYSSVNCLEEIRTGNGWLSIGGFSSQKSYESCLNVCSREKVTAQNCPCAKLYKGDK